MEPPVLGGSDLATIQVGDVLTLSIYGQGTVRAVDGPVLALELSGGEVREFKK